MRQRRGLRADLAELRPDPGGVAVHDGLGLGEAERGAVDLQARDLRPAARGQRTHAAAGAPLPPAWVRTDRAGDARRCYLSSKVARGVCAAVTLSRSTDLAGVVPVSVLVGAGADIDVRHEGEAREVLRHRGALGLEAAREQVARGLVLAVDHEGDHRRGDGGGHEDPLLQHGGPVGGGGEREVVGDAVGVRVVDEDGADEGRGRVVAVAADVDVDVGVAEVEDRLRGAREGSAPLPTARKVLGWPRGCKLDLSTQSSWGHSCRRLQFGQCGVPPGLACSMPKVAARVWHGVGTQQVYLQYAVLLQYAVTVYCRYTY